MDIGAPPTEQDAQVPRRPCRVLGAALATSVQVVTVVDEINKLSATVRGIDVILASIALIQHVEYILDGLEFRRLSFDY